MVEAKFKEGEQILFVRIVGGWIFDPPLQGRVTEARYVENLGWLYNVRTVDRDEGIKIWRNVPESGIERAA